MKISILILSILFFNTFSCCFTNVRNTLENALNRTRKSTTTTKSIKISLDKLSCGISYFKPSINGSQLNRIMYAEKSIPYSWPWTVAILYKFPDTGLKLVCAASLITSDYAITAAQCVPSENVLDYKLLIGINELNETLEANNINYITNITKHPEYKSLANDIAIIKLSQKVNISEKFDLSVCQRKKISL